MMCWFCDVRCVGRQGLTRHLIHAHVRLGYDCDRLPGRRLHLGCGRRKPAQAGNADDEGCGRSGRNRPAPEGRNAGPALRRPAGPRDRRILGNQTLVKLCAERGRNLNLIQGSDQCNRLPEGVHFSRAPMATPEVLLNTQQLSAGKLLINVRGQEWTYSVTVHGLFPS